MRLVVTKRRLLEWETAAAAAAQAAGLAGRKALRRFARRDDGEPDHRRRVAALVIAASATRARSPSRRRSCCCGSSRRSSPTGSACRSARACGRSTTRERALLRRTARKTWRYFETFVTEADAWLPPDNYQEDGDEPRLARRTSPTNIGMGLLSTLAAHDLGYLSTDDARRRLDRTLTTLEGLERHEGHFLNWYDTSTLAPLHPAICLDRGQRQPRRRARSRWRRGCCALVDRAADARAAARRARRHRRSAARASSSSAAGDSRRRGRRAINAAGARDRRRARARPHEDRGDPRSSALAPELAERVGARRRTTRPDTARRHRVLVPRRRRGGCARSASEPTSGTTLQALARRASQLADAMRFDFLYDRRRRIFSIGYRLADADGPGRLDSSFYDLLASEARLASFVAIAKGDVPQHHWFHLGRLVTNVNGRATLMSWGGTMFEYLMPLLLMRSFPGTLLDQSCRAPRAAADRIRARARRAVGHLGVAPTRSPIAPATTNTARSACPASGSSAAWPTSSSSRRTPRRWPAWSIPAAAPTNFERLAREGLDGRFGFYEAIDYRPREPDAGRGAAEPAASRDRARLLRAPPGHVARGARQRRLRRRASSTRFHADPRVQATELLLQERVPREAILSEPRPAEGATAPAVDAGVRIAAVPVAAHGEPAHAVPVERPLHRRADARRRRLQHVARPGGHAAARDRTSDARRALHLPARSLVGRRLVAHLSAGRAASRTTTT